MAVISEKLNQGDAMAWWRKAHEQLSGMKRRCLFLSPQDEGCLKQLGEKIGTST